MTKILSLWVAFFSLFFLMCFMPQSSAKETNDKDYEDLIQLFKEFRKLQKPRIKKGIPDNTAEAVEEKRQGLKTFKKRLAAIKPGD